MAKNLVPDEVLAEVNAEIDAVAENLNREIEGIDRDRLIYMKTGAKFKPVQVRRKLQNWFVPIPSGPGVTKEQKSAAKEADKEKGQKFGMEVVRYAYSYATAKTAGIPFPYNRPEGETDGVYGEDVYDKKGDWTKAIDEAEKTAEIAKLLKDVFQKGVKGAGPDDTEDMDEMTAALGLPF